MSFLGDNDLKTLIKSRNLIMPYVEARIQSGSYELSLGDEYFSTGSKGNLVKNLSSKNKHLVIKPGQFALLLTEETIEIPSDKIAFISIKASIKFSGLVNISGFHVDPGFKGCLKFSVYNAGPADIILERKNPCFIIWFCELTNNLSPRDTYNGIHQNQMNISVADLNKLKGELASPGVLLEKYNKLSTQLKLLWVLLLLLLTVLITILFEQYILKPQTDSAPKANNVTFDSSYIDKQVTEAVKAKLDCLKIERQQPFVHTK